MLIKTKANIGKYKDFLNMNNVTILLFLNFKFP